MYCAVTSLHDPFRLFHVPFVAREYDVCGDGVESEEGFWPGGVECAFAFDAAPVHGLFADLDDLEFH